LTNGTALVLLLASCADISAYPRLGKRIPALEDAIRIYHSRHHFLVYVVTESSVIFIAFLHERMDIMQRLSTRLSTMRPSQ
jgi:plasmid stabilization system protein ParE